MQSQLHILTIIKHSTVCHMINCFCFTQYGIHGELLKWLVEYFTSGSHQTRVGTTLSSAAELLSGVIQGSGISGCICNIH